MKIMYYVCGVIINNILKMITTTKKETVKVLGQLVTVGTKAHAKLVAQVKHFNDLSKYETN